MTTIQPVNTPDCVWILDCDKPSGYGADVHIDPISFHYCPTRRVLLAVWGTGSWWTELTNCDYLDAVNHANEMADRYAKIIETGPETYTLRVVLCGLWRDDCGWSENEPYRSAEITLPHGLSSRAEARRILASVDATGFRRDGWAGEDSWRSGTLGVYALLVE